MGGASLGGKRKRVYANRPLTFGDAPAGRQMQPDIAISRGKGAEQKRQNEQQRQEQKVQPRQACRRSRARRRRSGRRFRKRIDTGLGSVNLRPRLVLLCHMRSALDENKIVRNNLAVCSV